MTYPRSHLVSTEEPGSFHVVSRCVRRAFLCGKDQLTGKCFEHRRQWIEDRILELAECFAVSVYAFSVMSNHWHLVLYVDPKQPWAMTDEEVARCWLKAFPGPLKHADSPEMEERFVQSLLGNPDRLEVLRGRLGSLSWFMKALNEPIARMANREDGCTGKFWEGRFKCQALLEPHAVLSCMAYVDLNPVRAAMCETLIDSDHTSIQRRLKERESQAARARLRDSLLDRPLKPVAGLDANSFLEMTEASYIDLVQWTGEQARADKRGKLRREEQSTPPASIWTLADAPNQWVRQVQGTESHYYRVIGSAEALMAKAAELGQTWMKGISGERAKMLLRQQQPT